MHNVDCSITSTVLTFLIPVRHYANARDWSRSKAMLAQTVASVAAQAHPSWRGLIIANEGSDLPSLPAGFDVEWVQFPPNEMHERGSLSRETFLDVFRLDKGRRVLKGMLRARDSRYFMVVDDDDFVSARLTAVVAANPEANGWTVDRGYLWDDGGKLLLVHGNFHQLCGTSLIIRSNLYGLPDRFEDASPDLVKGMLGGHYDVPQRMAERGTPLSTLPLRGAVYRVGQSGSHSQAPSFLKKYFFNAHALTDPKGYVRNLVNLRLLSTSVRREFFGSPV